MLAVSKSSQPLVPRATAVRMGFLAALIAGLFYLVLFWQPQARVDPSELARIEPPIVPVPQLDSAILGKARDGTREERLFLESEPLLHLLEKSLNVRTATAQALGMPEAPVLIAELRAHPADWRGRWLWYKGKVEELSGPRQGHPVQGYDIWEATLRLPDGDAALCTFSLPPGEGVQVGGWARAEGFLLKLRDLTFPRELQQVPLLVGAMLQRDYEDWGTVEAIEQDKFQDIVDSRRDGDRYETTADAWHTIDEDQHVPLWHLGAYARDHAGSTLQEWRRYPAINGQATWDAFKKDSVARGTPMRILGTLVQARTIAAEPNPAGIKRWTEAWLQVADLGGKTVPVWIPKDASLPTGTPLEVRGYYFRRYAYESRRGQQYWTPLFVAADLDRYVMDTGPGLREIGWVAVSGTVVLLALAFFGTRRERKRSAEFEQALAERRRRRRFKAAPATGNSS